MKTLSLAWASLNVNSPLPWVFAAMLSVLSVLSVLAAMAAVVAPAPALAASSASSAASDSVGVSLGGLSGSLTTSSNSSSTRDVAQGDYQIIHIATANGRPDYLQLSLQRVAAEAAVPDPAAETVLLTLPQAAFAASGLGMGQRVAATHRSYGIEFARASDRQAFFLVLEDHWLKELAARPVTL